MALITIKKNPALTKMRGSERNLRMGFTKILRNPMIAPAITKKSQPPV
jgi:hypothetical protein